VLIITIITAALAGCKGDLPVDEVVMLENIEVVSGKHCESSAIVNALHYLGYDIDETTLFGAGGGISFLYQKGTFPFIGGRSGNLREAALDTLGITWFVENPGKELNDPEITKASEYTDACADAWHNLANDFRELSGQIKGIKNKEERISRYNKAELLAVEIYNCVQRFYIYLKRIGR